MYRDIPGLPQVIFVILFLFLKKKSCSHYICERELVNKGDFCSCMLGSYNISNLDIQYYKIVPRSAGSRECDAAASSR